MHPDLPHEQAYFDRALALRDRQQARLAHAPALAANPKAALELRKRVSRFGLTDPDEAVAFGRIDTEDDRWYIGKSAIWDDDNELVVVNWQAPIAAPFYTATPERPEGLVSRRLFRCTGNQIREIEDTVFRSVQRAVEERRAPEPVVTDALLESLGSARSGELREIVATIQASQYDVISRPLDQLLVVQGGPGTGKTVVGLHRVSWLLYNHRDRLDAADVLVVGPNPAFIRYVAAVLPSLGDEAVVQLPLRALGPRVRIGRVDPPEVRRLKGDRRLLRVILRGLRNRQRVEAVPVRVTAAGRTVELDGRRVATRARQLAGRPHNEGHRMLRAFLCAEARAALREAGAGEVDVQGEAARDIDAHLARVWPRLTPQAFLVELLSSRRQLLAAAAGTLTEDEMAMLALPSGTQVSSHQWSVDDVPLLDAADALLNGVRATYEHIVVDEAQDLSPMQLESVRRRSRTGSMTVLGDLAQGTSPWAHRSWDEIVQVLRHERVAATVVELDYGYRLPAEVHEVAMRLLPAIAPDLARPQALRSSGHEVAVTAAGEDDLPARTVEAVRAAADAGLVGVIAPRSVRPAVAEALDAEGVAWAGELRPNGEPVVVLAPDEAKGLEFDAVVVVEPAAVVEEGEHGLRALFVALTRCTDRLALVHARPLPPELGLDGAAPADGQAEAREAGGADAEVGPRGDDPPAPAGGTADGGAGDEAVPAPAGEAPVPVGAEGPDPDTAELAPAPPADVGGPPCPAAAPSSADDEARSEEGEGRPGDGALDGAGDDGPPDRVPEAVPPGPAEAGAPRSPDLAALDGLDDDVVRAIATAVADRLGRIVRPEVLPAVVAELARIAEERRRAAAAPAGNGDAAPDRPGAPAPHG